MLIKNWYVWKFYNFKTSSRALKQVKSMIIAGVAESKKDHAIELLAKLEVGMDELQNQRRQTCTDGGS